MEACVDLAQRAIEKGLPPRVVLSVAKVESKFKSGVTGKRGECDITQTSPKHWMKKEFAHLHNNNCIDAGLLALDLLSRCSSIDWSKMGCYRERKKRDWKIALCQYNGGNRSCGGKARFYSRKVLAMANSKSRRIY